MVAHADILLSKCAQFRNERQFIDVQLKVSEDIFPAHHIARCWPQVVIISTPCLQLE